MKIAFVPNQPHCYAFGGFEIQMLSAFDALKAIECDVTLFNPWAREANFDIVHVWGLEISQTHNIRYAHQAGKKVVVSVLMPDLSTPYKRLRFFVSGLIYKIKIVRELIPFIDCIITVNDQEKNAVHRYYDFPKNKISVVPNIIAGIYRDGETTPNNLGISDFVLCVGNICARKNQLKLVRAAHQLGFPVLLMGNILPGEEQYSKLVTEELESNPKSKWIQNVRENSPELKAAFQHCRVFALVSYLESQPISILEAMAMKCKILIADRPYAYQELFKGLTKADPDDIDDIKNGLIQAGQRETIMERLIINCSAESVGQRYKEIYEALLQ